MSKFGWIVRHGAHDPISCGLPHGIKHATEDVKQDVAGIVARVDVYLWRCGGGCCATILSAGLLGIAASRLQMHDVLLIEERPDMDYKNHNHENTPPTQCSGAARVPRLIKKYADRDGANDLG